MDPVKTDNEGELTSTMDNVISVPSKDEKSDTSSDATPTSSTDANIRPAASQIALDDPISSTSSDSLDQIKVKMDKGDNVTINIHRVSTDNEADLLDITNITNNEKITEDVEDLVHDLESLLGESTDSFSVTSKFSRKHSLKSVVGNSSKDTTLPKDNSDVVDDVLQELEEFTGNGTTDNAAVKAKKDSRETVDENIISVKNTDEKVTESDLKPSDVCDGKNVSVQDCNTIEPSGSENTNVVTNSEHLNQQDVLEIEDGGTTLPSNTADKPAEEESSSSNDSTNQQETFCIQDQDISHSEPKENLEKAKSTTSETSKGSSEDLPSKTDNAVTSSEGDPNETMQSEIVDEKSDVTGSDTGKQLEESENINTTKNISNEEITKKSENITEQATNSREKSEGRELVGEEDVSENKVECNEVSKETVNECIEKVEDILPSEEELENIGGCTNENIKTDSGKVDCQVSNIVLEQRKDDSDGKTKLENETSTHEDVDSTNLGSVRPSKLHESTNIELLVKKSETNKYDMVETTSLNIVQENSEVESRHSNNTSQITNSGTFIEQDTESTPKSGPNTDFSNSEDTEPNVECKIVLEPSGDIEGQNEIFPSTEEPPSEKHGIDLGKISMETNEACKDSKICGETDEEIGVSQSQSEEFTSDIKIESKDNEKSEIDATVAPMSKKAADPEELGIEEPEQNIPVKMKCSLDVYNESENSKVVESLVNDEVTESVISETASKEQTSDLNTHSNEPALNTSCIEVCEPVKIKADIGNEIECSVPSSTKSLETVSGTEDAVKQKMPSSDEEKDLAERKNHKELERMDETSEETNVNEGEINEEPKKEGAQGTTAETTTLSKDSIAESRPSTASFEIVVAKDDEEKTTNNYPEKIAEENQPLNKDIPNEGISQPDLEISEAPEELSEDEVPNLVLEPDGCNVNKTECPSLFEDITEFAYGKIEKTKGKFETEESTEENEKDIDNEESEKLIPKDDKPQECCALTNESETNLAQLNVTVLSNIKTSNEEKSEETATAIVEVEDTDKPGPSENDEPMDTSVSLEESSPAITPEELVTETNIPDVVETDLTEIALSGVKKVEPEGVSVVTKELINQSNSLTEEKCDVKSSDETEAVLLSSLELSGLASSDVETPPMKIPYGDMGDTATESEEKIETPSITKESEEKTPPTRTVEEISESVEFSCIESDKSPRTAEQSQTFIEAANVGEHENVGEMLVKSPEIAESVELTKAELSNNGIEASVPTTEQSLDETVDQPIDKIEQTTKSPESIDTSLEPVSEPSVSVTELPVSLTVPGTEPTVPITKTSMPYAETATKPVVELAESIVEPVSEIPEIVTETSAQVVESSELTVRPPVPEVEKSELISETIATKVESSESTVVLSEPIVEPDALVVEPCEQVAEPVTGRSEPIPESSEPMAESSEPIADSSEPRAESSESSAELYDLKAKPSESKAEPSKPKGKLTEPKSEPFESKVEPSESKVEPSDSKVEPSEPNAEPSVPKAETTEPIDEPSVPIDEPSEPIDEPSEPIDEPSETKAKVLSSGEEKNMALASAQAHETIESKVVATEKTANSAEQMSEDICGEVLEITQIAVEGTVQNEEIIEQDETVMAVASLEGINMETNTPSFSEKEKHEMEALRQAVESITDSTQDNGQVNDDEEQSALLTSTATENSLPNEVLQVEDNVIQDVDLPADHVDRSEESKSEELIKEAISQETAGSEDETEIVVIAETNKNEVESHIDDVEESGSSESVQVNEVSPNGDVSSTQLNNSELIENTDVHEDVLPDSSQSVSDTEVVKDDQGKEHKARLNERPRRHKKINDARSEEDASDKEKPYSPKVTIKPIKAPEEEVSTTSTSEAEAGKGSLKMTITKQSDKMHSILKVSEAEQVETTQEQEEPLPKLKIKSKPVDQTPVKMSTRSSRQTHQTNTANASQRSSSPRITIKPLVKPETLSPLKIKIGLKTDESTKKHSPKLNIKPLPKPEDEPKEMTQSPRKVVIKNIVKPPEEEEPAPKITIKPIPKPETEKETPCVSPKLNIKPIRKPEEEENDTDKHSPKITIKPVVKPPEPDSHSDENEDENKKRIVLKINKGNLPAKESRKREHSQDDDKAEKLAKITVKFSKEGGHPHIVQQSEETLQKRPLDDPNHLEKNKKQKIEAETIISTRSKQKEHIDSQNNPCEPLLESNENNTKPKQQTPDNPGHGSSRGKRKDSGSNSPTETKRSKLKETKQKDNSDTKKVLVEEIAESATVNSPLTAEAGSVPENPGPNITPIATPDGSFSTPASEVNTPVVTPQPRKRGRPRKIPLEQRPGIETPPTPTESGRPKRSCRGQSALDTLGLKPRKPRANKGGRGGAKAASGETRASSMKSEKETKLSQANLKLMQKAISEAGSVNVISVGTGDDKSVDIEDVLPQTQVEKKNVDSAEDKIVEVASKSEVESQSCGETKDFETDKGKNLKSVLQQAIKSKLSEKESVDEPDIKKRHIENDKEDVTKQQVSNISEVVAIKEKVESKRSKDNVESERESALDDSAVDSSELKQEIKLEVSNNPNPKARVVDTNPSTSDETGVPSSSTSLSEEPPEAMLVSDPVPQDASVPKSFGVSEDSLLLAPESSSAIQSAVSSTTGPSEVVMVDEETRMSADTSSRAQTPAKQIMPLDTIEESQSSVQSTATTESGKASTSRPSKAPRLEVQEPEGSIISPDQLAEYYWNGQGPYMLQEQVAHFLGIKSFKRKYPGIKRRMLEMQERDFIRDSGLVSEHMCDLGLTAVNSADILDIMYSDFQDKYEEYCKHQRDRQTKELINKQKALSLAASQEKNKADLTENAKQSAAQWNANFNKARKEQRRACMDLQTYTVHFPKGRMKQFSKGKPGNFPVALVPGQFTDYYKEFTPTEINNLPLNTMCYEPIDYIRPEESSDSGSDCSDSDSDSSSSSSDSDSSSSSGVDDCNLCKHSPKKVVSPTTMK